MFRFFDEYKPGRRKVTSLIDYVPLTMVKAAIHKAEEIEATDFSKSREYLQQAERLYHHWQLETGRTDGEINRKLDGFWLEFMNRIDTINARAESAIPDPKRKLYK
ncbi:MAG TPA: hypothetical protein VJB13_00870 [Candidatus Nanoarchaeia archaeon]|nr:hypothetical protein [Candidatus Nanoarchaeia archaeon]